MAIEVKDKEIRQEQTSEDFQSSVRRGGIRQIVKRGDVMNVRNGKTPASASASGKKGDWSWDSNYIYICVDQDTWKRVAISTW